MAEKRSYVRKYTPFQAVQIKEIRTPLPADPTRRTCGYYREQFALRNLLFKYLKIYEDTKNGFFQPPTSRLLTKNDVKETLTEKDVKETTNNL